MHRRAVRLGVVALLLIGGVGASFVTRDLHRQLKAISAGSQEVGARIQALQTTVADIAAEQASYLAPDRPATQAAARVASLLQRITADTAAIRPQLRSVDASEKLQTLAAASAAFVDTDQRVRDRIREGDPALAAGTILGDARMLLATMRATLSSLGAGEAAASGAERAAIEQQIWSVAGALAVVWVLGILVLGRTPKAVGAGVAAPIPGGAAPEETPADAPGAPAVDLGAAADLCTAISRLTTAAALPDMLARAATVLDASGLILWMGAGEELFAATSHGYDPRVISRLGPIHRSADNATAAAWRTGEVRTVAGDMMSNGAVVAPMFGPANCIGVLAAEIRHGREDETATRAVASMIAAQLAAALSAWPAASAADTRAAATN